MEKTSKIETAKENILDAIIKASNDTNIFIDIGKNARLCEQNVNNINILCESYRILNENTYHLGTGYLIDQVTSSMSGTEESKEE